MGRSLGLVPCSGAVGAAEFVEVGGVEGARADARARGQAGFALLHCDLHLEGLDVASPGVERVVTGRDVVDDEVPRSSTRAKARLGRTSTLANIDSWMLQ